ncbi:hypothetical protein Tco_0684883 [Tanacetum coccineum]
MANDEPILTTMRFIPQHEVVQIYGAILPDYLTNPAMKESEAYKTYHDLATGKVQPKPKYVRRSSRSKTDEAPKPSSGKRVKAMAKVAKSRKKKQPALGLETLSNIALTKAEQLKLVTKQTSSDEKDDDDEANVGKDEDDDDDDDDHDHDDDDERTESDNDGDYFVYPKFSTHDDEARQEEVNEEDRFDPRVQTPSYVESTDDDDNDDEIQGTNVAGEEMDEEETNAKGKENELYKDVNVNLEGRHAEMTNAQQTNSSFVSSGFVSNMLNPRPDTGIDSIFTLNTKATSLVNVPVTTIAEPPLVSATTLPPPPLLSSHICNKHQFPHQQLFQAPPYKIFPTLALYSAVSSIPGIVDMYLANKMNEVVKTAVQKIIKNQVKEQVKAQVSKILPKIEKTINKQLKAEVMTRSSTESKTSLAIAANLSELELKKILIEKMESNKSIHISNEQKNLYKALVEAYKSDKLILDTYGDTVSFKRQKDDEDKDEEPSPGSNHGFKRRRAGKEPELTSTPKEKTPKSTERSKSIHKSAHAEEPMHIAKDLEEPAHQEFETEATEDQPVDETPQPSEWFQKPTRLPSPDRDWNKTLPAHHGPAQPWLSNLAREKGPRESFDELIDTPLDISAFMMNRLKVDTLTPELLADPTFELMKGTCKSLVELEYFFEEVYKATTDQLDWNNPGGQQYPHDLRKPLPLIPNSRGH